MTAGKTPEMTPGTTHSAAPGAAGTPVVSLRNVRKVYGSAAGQKTALADITFDVARGEFGVTVVFVTHDIDEAVYLADRVITVSKSPGVVTEIVCITLPRPRDQITTKADPAFARYREHLVGLVMNR